jgi:MYXO-CTERM domain-containing protein
MTFPSCRRTVWAVMVLLTVIVAVIAPSVALAQAPPGTPAPGAPPGQIREPPPTRTETRDDDFDNWGLLGLLGLVGLAGLLRRDRARSVTVADRPDRR